MTKIKVLEERFWEKVDIRGENECWEWLASTRSDGYGQIQRGRRGEGIISAHRVSWEIHCGNIPDGLHVLHTCDNKICVNPNHLFLGTNADNVRDKKEKGFQIRGTQMGTSKLSENDVIEIRNIKEVVGLSNAYLARLFGVSSSSISNIINRKRWAWLK